MTQSHIIKKCLWETTFDNESESVQLQNLISQWSNQYLKSILSKHFDKIQYSWPLYLEKVELDIGTINYSDIIHDLPHKFEVALQKFLTKIEIPQVHGTGTSHHYNDTKREEFLSYFLLNGRAPWWSDGSESHQTLLRQYIKHNQQYLKALFTKLGKIENVRRRMVSQWSNEDIKSVISLLEPYNDTIIFAFVKQLKYTQKVKTTVKTDEYTFTQQSWYWVLTHLLVERGTLFNTISFVKYTLWQMASQYNIEYIELLNQFTDAATELASLGIEKPLFLSALTIIKKEQITQAKKSTKANNSSDYWALLKEAFLHHHGEITIENRSITIGELFTSLSHTRAEKIVELIKSLGQEEKHRYFIIEKLTQDEKSTLISLLEPTDSDFILSYIETTESQLSEKKDHTKSVWYIVLSFLLVNRGSYFNRTQFVKNTLSRFAQQLNLDYRALLDLLIHSSSIIKHSSLRFELITILHDLKVTEQKEYKKTNYTITVYKKYLTEFLISGELPKSDTINGITLPSLDQITHHLYTHDKNFIEQLCCNLPKGRVSSEIISERLINIIGIAPATFILPAFGIPHDNILAIFLNTLYSYCLKKSSLYINIFTRLYKYTFSVLLDSNNVHNTALLIRDITKRFISYNKINFNDFIHELTESSASTIKNQLLSMLNPLADNSLTESSEHNFAFVSKYNLKNALYSFIISQLRNDVSEKELINSLKQISKSHYVDLLEEIFYCSDHHAIILQLIEKRSLPTIESLLSTTLPLPSKKVETIISDFYHFFTQSNLWKGAHTPLYKLLEKEIYFYIFSLAHQKKQFYPENHQSIALLLLQCFQSLQLDIDTIKNVNTNNVPSNLQSVIKQIHNEHNKSQPLKENAKKTPLQWVSFLQDTNGSYVHNESSEIVFIEIFTYGIFPIDITIVGEFSTKQFIIDLCTYNRDKLKLYIKNIWKNKNSRIRLAQYLPYSLILNKLLPQQFVSHLENLYKVIQIISFKNYTYDSLTFLFWEELLELWMIGNPSNLSKESFIIHFSNKLIEKFAIPPSVVQQVFEEHNITFAHNFPGKASNTMITRNEKSPMVSISPIKDKVIKALPINNCGIVILQSFYQLYFERLNLYNNGAFTDMSAQRRAIHYLQYLVSGHSETEEQHLILNKILCGLSPTEPVERGIDITAEEIECAEGLIEAMINYWDAIGSTSIEGFRGNWLLRDGLLYERDDAWELIVEKRAYDVLLNRAPFSYSMITLPWLEKMVRVQWDT